MDTIHVYTFTSVHRAYLLFSWVMSCMNESCDIWQFPLKMPHPWNPQHQESQIPRYKFNLNQNLNLKCFTRNREIWVSQYGGFRGRSFCSGECHKVLYGVAKISRLLTIIGLFCKRALWKRLYSAKETLNFREPTNRSHPIGVHRAYQTNEWVMSHMTWVMSGCIVVPVCMSVYMNESWHKAISHTCMLCSLISILAYMHAYIYAWCTMLSTYLFDEDSCLTKILVWSRCLFHEDACCSIKIVDSWRYLFIRVTPWRYLFLKILVGVTPWYAVVVVVVVVVAWYTIICCFIHRVLHHEML